ncbi:hypothetical protein [Thalassorhabdomicrobium marinisediminis]|uniref:hypothetical protein n=1 Tax=Thalassorhabdomicrobium marinisediminis TaxID=2170577 RepID=UPI0024935FED|nr:hypothetical protein [Thalassorhabdomicrobium marinisediminis]
MRFLILCLALVACGRTLTPGEQGLTRALMGDSFNASEVRLVEAGFIGMTTRTYPTRPQTTCRERIGPPPDGPTFDTRTAGAVAWTHVLTNPDWTLPDYAPNYPRAFNLVAVMYFVHEMTHVWQWQNRDTTGYSPLLGLAEHKPGIDPYLLDPAEEISFLELGYEQQAVLVEEFVCCRTLAPDAPRTQRLYRTLAEVMPVQPPQQSPRPSEIFGIDPQADLNGICD